MLTVAVFIFLLRKSKNGGVIGRKHAIYGPGLRLVSILRENSKVSDRYGSNLCWISNQDEVKPVGVHF